MVSGVIPGYRLTAQTLEADLDRLRQLGVPIHFGVALGRDLSLERLRQDFPHVFLAVGAQKGKRLGIPFETAPGVMDALDFLDQVRAGTPMDLGQRVLVIGGGNSAMDAARSARRLLPEGEVTLVYRRTRALMPADPAEVEECIEEGIGLRDLLAPLSVSVAGGRVAGLLCTRMRLGDRDASGRPRPAPVEGPPEFLPADTILSAISQEPVLDFLADLPLARKPNGTLEIDENSRETALAGLFAGGDVVHGASSIIQAIADGRAVAETLARRYGVAVLEAEPHLDKGQDGAALMAKKGRLSPGQRVPVLPLADRHGFEEVLQPFTAASAALEASRCLDCDDLCSLCVTVCPNRANQAYALEPFTLRLPLLVQRQGRLVAEGWSPFAVKQTVQTLNIVDFCNECGNCDTFCPAAGSPYKDKPRFWIDEAGYLADKGDVYRLVRGPAGLGLNARLGGRKHQLERTAQGALYRSDQLTAHLRAGPWTLVSWQAQGVLPEGAQVDLTPCATLVALLQAESALPIPQGDA